eukprot:TRINITY_DN5040_c0_g1_i1.p1 TRINITY_DN5040_c0_g1~~TRINITY_DN5040_c0_g1_i1.p1  ORF type:complete len:370 (-),score=101.86 TRINITY_DN5040_c0_g1_i1:143-1252(-)
MDDSTILKLKKDLETAVSEDNTPSVVSLLKKLGSTKISYELIKSTKIGISVGKLRKHENTEVASNSNELVDKWRNLVEAHKEKTRLTSSGEGSDASDGDLLRSSTEALRSSTENGTNEKASFDTKPQTPQKRLRMSTESQTPPNKVRAVPSQKDNKETIKEKPKEKRAPAPAALPTRAITKSKGTPPPKTPSAAAASSSPAKPNAGDIRQQMIDKFGEALGTQLTPESNDPQIVAKEIENALYEKWKGVNKDYHNQRRSLYFNLINEKNEELRLSVLEGKISPERLVQMTTQELASREMQQKRAETEDYFTKAAQANSNTSDLHTTDMFTCGKCKERKCTYSQLQTRSADEPMTTFITCCNCWNRWKIG